ncbi:MAG: glycosyltransferase WbuB [Cytophagales bacterium CG18_big_fil_WC_8_21_14_2_50_42_9]|nr:MAG: glycosyltransferase WbuB [Cytophagales bacterium CG18_big_fil_WC_8_21_14_2_50_42_9]
MKILYIHQYFRKPEQGGALRSYYLSQALVAAGYEVELITAYNGPSYYQEKTDGILVHYLPVAYTNNFSFAHRIKAFLKFTWQSLQLAFRIKNISLCYATSTPLTVGLVPLVLKKFKQIPYFFEVRDLWPKAPIQLGYIQNSLVKKLLYSFECFLYRQADKVIALSPGIAQGIKPHKTAADIALIPNMADCDFYRFSAMPRRKFSEPFFIGYFGAMGVANHLDFLLAAAQACQLNNLPQVKFILAGEGAEAERLQAQAKQLQLRNITWLGPLNREETRICLSSVHATYTSFHTYPVLQTNSPNKFFDSLAAGKLTIVNTRGWLQELVQKHNCGFHADPNGPKDFIQQLKPYLENSEMLQQAQQQARNLAEKEFSRQLLPRRFLTLFPASAPARQPA